MHAAPSRNQVILSCSCGAFGGIGSVFVWWDKLVINLFVLHVGFEEIAGFVVKSLERGTQAAGDKEVEDLFVGSDVFASSFVDEWFYENGIAVEIVKNEYTFRTKLFP